MDTKAKTEILSGNHFVVVIDGLLVFVTGNDLDTVHVFDGEAESKDR